MVTTIIFDFDGVILDSNPVRELGFREVLSNFPSDKVEKLISYHLQNGGLSRYHKFAYFFQEVLKETISQEKLDDLAQEFSKIMKYYLTKKENLISDTMDFIKSNVAKYKFFIASGSDQEELRYLCGELNIAHYFEEIMGSPVPKNDLVKGILTRHKLNPIEVCLIGDAVNDFEAAKINKISFWGYNNTDLKSITGNYIETFKTVKL